MKQIVANNTRNEVFTSWAKHDSQQSCTPYMWCTGFILFWVLQIPWFSLTFSMDSSSFPWPSVLAVTFENFQNYSCFGGILTQFNRHKNWCPPKFVSCIHTDNITCVYLTLSLLLTSAVTNLLNITWIFHDFKDRHLNSMTFQASKVKFLNILKFHGFPGFPWPVWTLMYALF